MRMVELWVSVVVSAGYSYIFLTILMKCVFSYTINKLTKAGVMLG